MKAFGHPGTYRLGKLWTGQNQAAYWREISEHGFQEVELKRLVILCMSLILSASPAIAGRASMVPEEITCLVEGIPGVRELEPFQADVSVRSGSGENPDPSRRRLYYVKGMIRSDAKGGQEGCIVLPDEPRIYFFDNKRWLEWKETEESKAASEKFDAERAEIERRLAEFDSESNDLNSLSAYKTPEPSPGSLVWVE